MTVQPSLELFRSQKPVQSTRVIVGKDDFLLLEELEGTQPGSNTLAP